MRKKVFSDTLLLSLTSKAGSLGLESPLLPGLSDHGVQVPAVPGNKGPSGEGALSNVLIRARLVWIPHLS